MTDWWNKNAENRIDDFKSWIGDFNQPSKVYCRKYIVEKQYKNIIDCGCGLATDYFGFKNDGSDINYTGLDSCKYFINLNKECGITMVEAELIKNLPLADDSYDCVYCREVIEHLPYYEKTINEFIRIAKKEIVIVFFIKPDNREDLVNYWEEEDLYHNRYNKEKLELFILNNIKVDKLLWVSAIDLDYVTEETIAAIKAAKALKEAEAAMAAKEAGALELAWANSGMVSKTKVTILKPDEEPSTTLPGEKIILHIILK